MEKFKTKKNGKTVTGQPADQIDIAPEIEEKPLKEEAEETHHVMVGGFSPFTTGHHAVAKDMEKSGGKSHIYTTQSTKRPISAENKVKYIKKAVGKDTSVHSTVSPHHALSHLYQSGARGHVVFHGGSDRSEIADRLAQYNGKEGKHGYYKFKSITFKQTGGERKEGAKGIAGVSGSLARKAKSPEELKKYLPKALHPHAAEIHKQINEEAIFEAVLDIAARRKRAMAMRRRRPQLERQKVMALKRFASDLKLKRRAQNIARNLVRARVAGKRGANYKNLSTSDKIAVDKMIQGKEKMIKAVAGRIYQRVRKREMERVSRVRSGEAASTTRGGIFASYEHPLSYELFERIYDRVSTNNLQLEDKEIKALTSKAEKYNIAFEKLKEVYYGGLKEWNSSKNIEPKQNAFNSVNAFLAKLKEGKEEDVVASSDYKITPSGRKVKAKEIVFRKKDDIAQTKQDDVQEQLDESFVIDRSAGMGVTYTARDLGMQTQGAFAHHPSVIAMMQEMEENFMDGKNPQDKGDMARHGLKGKSISQLKKIRSSDTASKRQKQLAHWFINMHGD